MVIFLWRIMLIKYVLLFLIKMIGYIFVYKFINMIVRLKYEFFLIEIKLIRF